MKPNELKVAVIGVGAMGQIHCETVKSAIPGMRLAAICNARQETARAAGERFDVPWFTDIHKLIDARCADAVLITVPHPLHAELAIPCMRAGMHVLCEKPLTETVVTADQMFDAAHNHNVAFGVMFQLRADPAIRAMIDFARAGHIGRIIRAQLAVPDFRSQHYFDSNPWRATWRGEGGGVLLNQASHMLDIFAQVAGTPQALLARCETRLHDIDVEDTAEAILRFEGGGSGYINCSTAEPAGAGELSVTGDAGRAVMRDDTVTLTRFPAGVAAFARQTQLVWGRPPQEQVFTAKCLDEPAQSAVLTNFLNHIRDGEPLWCDAASGMASLEIANAMTLSAAQKREVTLPVDRPAYAALLADLCARPMRPKQPVPMVQEPDPKFFRNNTPNP